MRFSTKIALASVSLISLAMPAYAAEAAAENDEATSGEEIIVQARRKDESVQDVPMVVQAVSNQELQKLEIRKFEDVTKLVPGLQLQKSGVSVIATLRGINFDSRASGSANSVEFYRNDAVITGTALFQAVYDIGQIEVLRGPQGTLRGRATPSGSITVTTKRPDLNQVGGFVSGSASDSHRWNGTAAINVPIIEGKLGVRVAGFVGENRGNGIFGLNVPNNTLDKNIYDRTKALRASIRADPLDGVLVLDFSYETIANDSKQYNQIQSVNTFTTGAASSRTITTDDRLGVGSMPESFTRRYQMYNWQAVLRQFGQKLSYVGSKTRIRQLGLESSANLGGTDPQGLFPSLNVASPPAFGPISQYQGYTDNWLDQITHEIRLQNEDRVAGMFDYVIGAFQVKADGPSTIYSPSATSVTPIAGTPYYTLNSFSFRPNYRYRSDKEQSLFGNVTLHLGDATEISGGMRRIWFKADSGLRTGAYSATPADQLPDNPAIRRCFGNPQVAGCLPTKTATIYSASIKHNLTPDHMIYASWGKSWRPGNTIVGYGLREGVTTPTFLTPFLNLPDETSNSYEVGIKTAWLDRKLRFNLTGYYQKFNNFPLFVPGVVTVVNTSTTSTPTLVQISPANFAAPVPATVKGIEADMAFDVSEHFNMSATLAFADSKVSNAVVPCVPTTLNPLSSTFKSDYYALVGANAVGTCPFTGPASTSPRWSGSFQAEYSQSVGFGDAFLRGFVSWKGATDGETANVYDSVSAYALADLFLGVRDPKGAWEISAFAKNILNTKRVLTRGNIFTESLPGGLSVGNNYSVITTLDPREVGISLRLSFGSR